MVRGLLNVMEGFQWDPNQDTKALVFNSVLGYLAASSQDTYIYHASKGKRIAKFVKLYWEEHHQIVVQYI